MYHPLVSHLLTVTGLSGVSGGSVRSAWIEERRRVAICTVWCGEHGWRLVSLRWRRRVVRNEEGKGGLVVLELELVLEVVLKIVMEVELWIDGFGRVGRIGLA